MLYGTLDGRTGYRRIAQTLTGRKACLNPAIVAVTSPHKRRVKATIEKKMEAIQ